MGTKSILDASTWMDEVRKDYSYDVLKPLHYINVERGQAYTPTDGNIISEINKTIEELKNRKSLSTELVAIDLKILIHLLGDLHQPLHVGYGSDRGGNSVELTYLGTETNLHKVWDSEIIRTKGITADSCFSLRQTYDIRKVESGDITSWMLESRTLLDKVYHFTNDKLDTVYVENNMHIVKQQLLFSGLRMAKILQDIFGYKRIPIHSALKDGDFDPFNKER